MTSRKFFSDLLKFTDHDPKAQKMLSAYERGLITYKEAETAIIDLYNNPKSEIEKLAEQFNIEYNFLYDNRDNVAGYDEAVTAFDEMIKTDCIEKTICRKFAEYRQDIITSDREAAAFMFALEKIDIEKLTANV